ncbi:MAG: ribosome-associated translation inhibitor RaiA [Anaerolineae bacterium]|nr:ribosome-associated translation inhibitor RaiA [Thermoflexales bacterium]MDW8395138.1 ribosome-associated translation inhibitor RaiA [Anaerolineae bacterium]
MNITIQGHSMIISQRLEKYVRAKADKLDRYLPGIEDIRVEFTRESSKHDAPKSVELTIRRGRTLLRVEEHNTDPFAAFDAALDKMYHRIARYKGRRIDRKRNGSTIPLDAALEEAEPLPIEAPPAEPEPKLVRIKTFKIVPMSVEEAIEQMELLGHDFFFFMDEDGTMKVAYRRKSGGYGLLQPEK